LKKTKQQSQFIVAKILITLLARLSLKNCHRIGTAFGWLFYVFPNRMRHVTRTNIRLCFPDMSSQQQQKLIKASLIETGKTLTEASPMWTWPKEKLLNSIKKVQGEELLTSAITNNKGIILALPHLGNWELLGLYCSNKYPTTSMYQKPKVQQLDSIVKHGRERLGAKLVPADNHGVRAMLKSLKNNECVCILPDQEPTTGSGVFAPFFATQAYSASLISRLAKKTHAEVIIAYTKRLPSGAGYEIIFSKLEEMQEKLNSESLDDSVIYLNAELEKTIRDVPEQYQWGYKRFRTQPQENNAKQNITDYYN
jgi:KDO2-lipid IV(A) lauroyltransferase